MARRDQAPPDARPLVFIGYARSDNDAARKGNGWRDRLLVHLRPFEKNGDFTIFYDERTETGDDSDALIQEKVERCDIAVLLVSGHFLDRDYIREKEMPTLLRREAEGTVRLVPVVLSQCNWDQIEFGFVDSKGHERRKTLASLQSVLPTRKPLKQLSESKREEALAAVAAEVRKWALTVREERPPVGNRRRSGRTPPPTPQPPKPRLPDLASMLSAEQAAQEWCPLVYALVRNEARRQGCQWVEVEGKFMVPTGGFMTAIVQGTFCGMKPPVRVSAIRMFDPPTDERDHLFPMAFPLGGPEDNDRIREWLFLVRETPTTATWERVTLALKRRDVIPHLITLADLEPWLFGCPALLARYYPAEAAKLDGSHGFEAVNFRGLERDFLDKELPRHRDLSLLGMPRRFTQHQDIPTPLGEVFVPQKFQAYGTNKSAKSLGEVLVQGRPCVLVGDPGSGKTTVLRFLALLYAGEAALPETQVGPRVPLFLALRDFAKSRLVRPTLVDALVHDATLRGVAGVHRWFFESLLLMGSAVVLLDGLDEAGDHTTRAQIADLIEAFNREYPSCPIWVTTREVGYVDTARIDGQGFGHFRVLPLAKSEQRQFVGKWYDIQMSADPAGRESKKRRFLQAVDKMPAVQRLAGNPLLLTLMALVHHYQHELPRNRGELYEQCVEMLLKHWQQSKSSGHPEDDSLSQLPLEKLRPPIHTDDAKKLLAVVALRVQELNERRDDDLARGDIRESLLRELCEERRACQIAEHYLTTKKTEHARSQAKEDIAVFLDYVRERSGLLIWRGTDVYAFAHLSFLEFLAAYQRSGDRGVSLAEQARFFREKSSLPSWREALIQLLYLLAKNPSDDGFVDLLLSPEIADGAPAGFWRTLGVAVSDELVPTAKHVRSILEQLWLDWSTEPEFAGDAWAVLQQISEFGETARQEALRDLLDDRFRESAPHQAVSALHLRVRLFGWPDPATGEPHVAADRLRTLLDHAGGTDLVERAGQLLADAGPEVVSREPQGNACVGFVRDSLLARMRDPARPAKQRAVSGGILGCLADPRRGVVPLRREDLAEIEFCFVPGDSDRGEGKEAQASEPDIGDFWIARYPVTVAQFRLFATAENYRDGKWWAAAEKAGFWKEGRVKITDPDGRREHWVERAADLDSGFDSPNHPRVHVNWFEAAAFAAWLDDQIRELGGALGELRIRLPTDGEWLRAVHGGRLIPRQPTMPLRRLIDLKPWSTVEDGRLSANPDPGRKFPWGNEEPGERVNWWPTEIRSTSAVGCFLAGASPVGAEEMAGNVWEWTASEPDRTDSKRVSRGGSWGSVLSVSLSTVLRYLRPPGRRLDEHGFRLVCGRKSY